MVIMTMAGWKARAQILRRDAYALYLCSRHPGTPLYAKLFALIIAGYALSPIDLIPDFIPVIGYLDDLILIPAGMALLIRMVPGDVLRECRQKAQAVSSGKKFRSWAGAIAILCIWALAVYVTFRFFVRLIQG
jgi:uncharacterized membrane protein YkvA (DUF1232 family)